MADREHCLYAMLCTDLSSQQGGLRGNSYWKCASSKQRLQTASIVLQSSLKVELAWATDHGTTIHLSGQKLAMRPWKHCPYAQLSPLNQITSLLSSAFIICIMLMKNLIFIPASERFEGTSSGSRKRAERIDFKKKSKHLLKSTPSSLWKSKTHPMFKPSLCRCSDECK